jgi:hypothetical protein
LNRASGRDYVFYWGGMDMKKLSTLLN